MVQAIWQGQVIAESDATVQVEGNHYFPADSIRSEYFRDSKTQTTCGWKGVAQYYDVVIGDHVNSDAAWYYADPKDAANNIKGHIAFWKGVQVTGS